MSTIVTIIGFFYLHDAGHFYAAWAIVALDALIEVCALL